MGRGRIATLAVLLCLSAAVTPAGGDEPPAQSVQVDSDDPGRTTHILQVLGLEPGRPVDRQRLREGVLALYAGGDVDSLRVEARRLAEGLQLTVRVRLKPSLRTVAIRGPGPGWRRRIRSWLGLQEGTPVTAAAVETGVRRVLRELRERGYTRARVEPFLDYDRPSNSVRVLLQADLGTPQLLTAVTATGLPDGLEAPRAVTEAKLGERLDQELVERLRQRVERQLREQGYWEAEVLGTERRSTDAGVILVLRVDAGAHYVLSTTGPHGADKLVASALPDPVEEDLHPAQTAALAERIREELQSDGWLLASVRVELVSDDAARTLRIELEPDHQRRITSVQFRGATSLDAGLFEEAVQVHEGKTSGWRGQKVTDASLDRDRQALASLYQEHGFADVVVGPVALEAVGEQGARIAFNIDEGQRWLLATLRLEGFPVGAMAVIEGQQAALAQGGPWDPRAVEPERRRLELALANAGYPDGRVTATVDTSQPGQAGLVMRADAGHQVRIGEVVISGLRSVDRAVVERTIHRAGIRSGAPFTVQAILEAQRKLYELGLFRRVELVPIPGQERRPLRGIVVRCEEGAHRSYLLGAGWDTTESARVTLGWSHLNLFGGAHALSAETRLSGREQRYQLSLREPSLLWIHEPAALVAYRTEEEFSTYSQKRRGLWFEFGDRRRRPLRRWLRYEYQIVRPDAPPEVLSSLERQEREIAMTSLTPSFEWDTRDDPLRPTRGLLASLSAEFAFPLLQADARFVKVRGGLSLYGTLPGGTGALGLRLGAIHPIATDGDGPENLEVPINVRFFSGGVASHRAFATDRLGVPGQTLDEDGNAIGGNAQLLINAEYQRPVRGPVSAVLFLDVGNVWSEPSTVRLGDLRWGAGLGVRVDTPAGPLRLEYGIKLDEKQGESTGELFFSFGVPF